MDNRHPQTFTVAQIARALSKSPQAIRKALAGVEAVVPSAQSARAAAWSLRDLPGPMREELEQQAMRWHFSSVAALLCGEVTPWEPEVPVSEISQDCLEEAGRLMRALEGVLSRIHADGVSAQELTAQGIRDFKAVYGRTISARHFNRLLTRTLDRDRGQHDWNRIEIYLGDRIKRRRPTANPSRGDGGKFDELHAAAAGFQNPIAPTKEELRYFWMAVLDLFEQLVSSGMKEREARSQLLDHLQTRPFLNQSREALNRAFKRKHAAYVAAGCNPRALRDGRRERSGNRRSPELSQEDREKLIARAALHCDGRLAQAWRELCESGELSEEVLEYYRANPCCKSYVPRKIRETVRNDVRLMDDIHHGPHTHKMKGAFLSRDWSDVASMDWIQGDDCTCPVYYYVPDGKGRYSLIRGQLLLMIDVRSTKVLGFALQHEKSYNARVIRTLITNVCEEHGLPRKGFYFEQGIWKTSRILKGTQGALGDKEMELGLREFGLEFIHARVPRAKLVERVLGAFQNLMERDPGYVGRDERKDRYERVEKLMQKVRSGKVDPAQHFYDKEQWQARLFEICEAYNREPQEGKLLKGLSPNQGFEAFKNEQDPPVKFGASCRYLLAHHKRVVKVQKNGITLRFGNQVYNYKNHETGCRIGEEVLAWFNPDRPEILSVTDLERRNPFSVERCEDVPAMDADSPRYAASAAQLAAHESYAKATYRTIKSKHGSKFRQTLVDGATARLGREIESQQSEIDAARKKDSRHTQKARRRARELNVPPEVLTADPESTDKGLRMVKEAYRLREQEKRKECK